MKNPVQIPEWMEDQYQYVVVLSNEDTGFTETFVVYMNYLEASGLSKYLIDKRVSFHMIRPDEEIELTLDELKEFVDAE